MSHYTLMADIPQQPGDFPCVLLGGSRDPSLSKTPSRAPHSAPSQVSARQSFPGAAVGPGRQSQHLVESRGRGWGGWRGGLFVVLAALMSQARQGHRKEESDYSKDGQCSRQPERTLQPPGLVARERQPARLSPAEEARWALAFPHAGPSAPAVA